MRDNSTLYGIGKGGAQIIDTTSGAQQQFSNLLARQQQQRQLELKQLTDQQAQLKPDGLRNDADRQDFFNQVNDWRQKSINAINEPDPYKKSLAQSQAQQAFMQAQSTVAQSKRASEQENQFSGQLLNPTVRDRYAPDVVNSFLNNKQLGINNPAYVKDPNQWEQIADHEATLKQLDAIDKNRLNQTPFGTPGLSTQKVGNRNATFITNSRVADPNALASDIIAHARVDQNMRKTFQDLYPQIYADQSLTPDQHLQAAVQQYQKDRGPVAEYKAPVEKADKAPDLFYVHRDYAITHPLPGTSASNQPTPAQTLVTDMQKGVPGSGEKLLSLVPRGQYGAQKPVIGLDNKTGEHIFTFPAISEPDKKGIAKNVQTRADAKADNNAVDPADLVPESIVKQPAKTYRLNPNSPSYIADVAAMAKDQNINLTQLNQIESVKGGHGQIPQVKQPPQGKTIPAQTIKSLVGKKGYEGYSEQELTDYYKKQGYHIK